MNSYIILYYNALWYTKTKKYLSDLSDHKLIIISLVFSRTDDDSITTSTTNRSDTYLLSYPVLPYHTAVRPSNGAKSHSLSLSSSTSGVSKGDTGGIPAGLATPSGVLYGFNTALNDSTV
jgi:hypothetical protein